MDLFQQIWDVAEICHRKGVEDVVLSPGSRCAPLTLAFTRHPAFRKFTFSDERSAAYIALGIAQQRRRPVVLVCTSGTAALNYAPALAEALFLEVPLLVFTADRPAEWIGQQDGQAIFQNGVYGRHVKAFYTVSQDYEREDHAWHLNRIINESVNLSIEAPGGPVHVNFPFYEPLYPGITRTYSKDIRIMRPVPARQTLDDSAWSDLTKIWKTCRRVMIVAGQHAHHEKFKAQLDKFTTKYSVPLAADITGNLHGCKNLILRSDLFLEGCPPSRKESLRPDLLITFGGQVISKNLKLFLRQYSPTHHWHIREAGTVADPFQHVTEILRCASDTFFEAASDLPVLPESGLLDAWQKLDDTAQAGLDAVLARGTVCELCLVNHAINRLDSGLLHLANSMSVRYANFTGLRAERKVEVFANRGTSGIDGCTSTAMGHALASDRLNVLITGDMAFFHDRNAFWHNYQPANLRVIVLNNHGGLIFDLIDGPSALTEKEEYFVTRQSLTAESLCREFGFDYVKLDATGDIERSVDELYKPGSVPRILELETGMEENKRVFEDLKNEIKRKL